MTDYSHFCTKKYFIQWPFHHWHLLAYQYLHSTPYTHFVRGNRQYYVALITESFGIIFQVVTEYLSLIVYILILSFTILICQKPHFMANLDSVVAKHKVAKSKENVCHRFKDQFCCRVVRCAQITNVLAHAAIWPRRNPTVSFLCDLVFLNMCQL